jgi:hypothetical protein
VDGWRLWQAGLEGRAWDMRAGNGRLGSATTTQTENGRGIWNSMAHLDNAWHRVRLTAGSARAA